MNKVGLVKMSTEKRSEYKACEETYEHLSDEGRRFYGKEAKERGIGRKQYFIECCLLDKGREEGNTSKSNTLKIAESIARMADATEDLLKKGFNRKLLILYVQSKTKLSQGNINAVLEAVEEFIDETKHQEQ